jgi:tetratricopeptide (TPR) repeat protein/DNA-binding CsgD family transcriptional regulator
LPEFKGMDLNHIVRNLPGYSLILINHFTYLCYHFLAKMKIRLKQVLLLSCFFTLLNINLYSNDESKADSLIRQLETQKEDTSKVDLLIKLFKLTNSTDVKLSLDYANGALLLSKKLNYDKGIAISNYSLALIFVDYDFKFSEELIIESMHYAEKIRDSLLIAKIENTIGQLKNNLSEYKEALQHFNKSLDFFLKYENDSLAAAIYNNIAISYIESGNDSLALINYLKAAEINERTGNTLWLANNYYNMGTDYLGLGNIKNGLTYLDRSYKIAIENQHDRLIPYILYSFGEQYFENQQYAQARIYARQALTAAQDQLNRVLEKNILILLKNIYYQEKDIDSAYHMQEKIIAISDSIKKKAQLSQLDYLEMKFRLQEQIKENELRTKALEAENERKELIITIIILIIGIILLAFLFIFNHLRIQIQRKSLTQKAVTLEKEKLAKELEYKKKELTANVMYLTQKSEFIADISKRLQSIKVETPTDQENFIKRIIGELDRNTANDGWLDFETRFKEVHSDFNKKLSEKFPNLSPNELKLCAFLKLNLSTKDISSLTFQSAETIKIARHRLRKKLGLTRDDNLVTFLTQI